jgi:hypothetical protein
MAEVFKDQLGGDENKGGVADVRELRTTPASPCKRQCKSNGTGGEGANEGDVMNVGNNAKREHVQEKTNKQGCQRARSQRGWNQAKGLAQPSLAWYWFAGAVADKSAQGDDARARRKC